MNRVENIALIIGLIQLSGFAFAEGCGNYPYTHGDINVTETDAGVKILATGGAAVEFDDMDEVNDAMMEAQLEAKAIIAEFFSTSLKSDKSIDTAVNKTIKMVKDPNGSKKTATKEKVKVTLKRISSNSEAMLRGVVKLASCYEKGQNVLVTVGLKPETIAAAEATTGAIADSMVKQPTATAGNASGTPSGSGSQPGSSSTSGGESGMSNPEGFSRGVENLKGF